MNYHEKCDRLRTIVRQLKEARNAKADKEALLSEARVLEKDLGFTIGNYNSDAFGIDVV